MSSCNLPILKSIIINFIALERLGLATNFGFFYRMTKDPRSDPVKISATTLLKNTEKMALFSRTGTCLPADITIDSGVSN